MNHTYSAFYFEMISYNAWHTFSFKVVIFNLPVHHSQTSLATKGLQKIIGLSSTSIKVKIIKK